MRKRTITEILLAEGDIAARVAELGKDISVAHGASPLTVVGVMNGALFFVADLARKIESPTTISLVRAASYGDADRPQGPPQVSGLDDLEIAGRDVLLVDDIVDTGHTLCALTIQLEARAPRSLKTCVLLNKPDRREVDVRTDYVGFEIPDRFVVGYGLDFAGQYRSLPHIAILAEAGEPAADTP